MIFTPDDGQPGLSPWRLASILTMQFYKNLADHQAAEAVWARIDWKYLLGLELTPQNAWHRVERTTRQNASWQSQIEDGYTADQSIMD